MQKQTQAQGRASGAKTHEQRRKPKLRVTKVVAKKRGMNAGISGGNEQCC